MRQPTNVRYLAAGEIGIAKDVYKESIPYDSILISDGLGGDDRPFTVPTILPLHVAFGAVDINFNVKGDGKYVIHAGDGYYGMSTVDKDQATLIHELAHVWQGEHYESWSWTYVVFSLKDQITSDDAYAYDKTRLGPWDDYGPEQQAQIVEDWFVDKKKTYDPTTDTGDLRFYYIKKYIRGERVDYNWLMPGVKPLPAGTLHVSVPRRSWDTDLIPILERHLRSDDHAGIAARRRDLEDYFQRIDDPDHAQNFISRLESRRRDDKLAQSFQLYLSTPERQRLLHILRTKLIKR
jgi:hypothetical protein